MFYHLIRYLVVVLCQLLRVPFNRNEALLDQIFLKDRSISRQNDTSTALHSPVAKCTGVAWAIHCFENEGCVDTVTWLGDLSPIFTLPPACHGPVKARIGFEHDVRACPNFIIDSSSRWDRWHSKEERIRNELGHILEERMIDALDEASMVPNYEDILW